MEILLSKEHYCYQIQYIHTNEKQCLPPFCNRQTPHFYKKRELHTINIIYIIYIYIYTDSQEFFAQTVKQLRKNNLVNLLVNLGLILI